MQLALWSTEPDPDRSGVHRLPAAVRSRSATPITDKRLPLDLDTLTAEAERYVQAAHAERTRRAYRTDWAAFEAWCHERGAEPLPTTERTLELYLTHLAKLGRKASTIRRARIAIGLAHGHAGLERPDHHARIRALERGIGRLHGAREEGAPPLLEHDLKHLVAVLGDSAREERDRAMLLVGFAGGFRSSELAALNVNDVTFSAAGLIIDVRRSKEDQLGHGERTAIPLGQAEATCPVRALQAWMARVGRPAGPLFRVVRGDQIEHRRIHPRAVSRAVQRAVVRANMDGHYSSHSLRSGLATSAYAHGASRREIQLQGRWKDPRSVDRYIRLECVSGRRNIVEGLL